MTLVDPPRTQAERQALLDAAYRHCAAINAEHGKSYHLATRLLTADRRPAIHALYAAARTADDLVDHPGADPERDLADWSRALLDELEAGWSDDPVRLALVHTYRRYDIPLEHLVDFLAAMTSDLDVTGYADMDALDRYMWGSASVIGLQVLPVLGTAPGVAREEAAGRRCPADWSWIVPPMSGALTPVFHRYYDEPEPGTTPAFLPPPAGS